MSSCRLSHKDRHLAGKPVGVPHFVPVAHSWPLVLHGWPHIWQHGGFYSLRVQNFHKVRAEREAAVGEARELPFQRVCAACAQSSDATSAFNNLPLFPSRHSFMRLPSDTLLQNQTLSRAGSLLPVWWFWPTPLLSLWAPKTWKPASETIMIAFCRPREWRHLPSNNRSRPTTLCSLNLVA